jgi:hypothetical protein
MTVMISAIVAHNTKTERIDPDAKRTIKDRITKKAPTNIPYTSAVGIISVTSPVTRSASVEVSVFGAAFVSVEVSVFGAAFVSVEVSVFGAAFVSAHHDAGHKALKDKKRKTADKPDSVDVSVVVPAFVSVEVSVFGAAFVSLDVPPVVDILSYSLIR